MIKLIHTQNVTSCSRFKADSSCSTPFNPDEVTFILWKIGHVHLHRDKLNLDLENFHCQFAEPWLFVSPTVFQTDIPKTTWPPLRWQDMPWAVLRVSTFPTAITYSRTTTQFLWIDHIDKIVVSLNPTLQGYSTDTCLHFSTRGKRQSIFKWDWRFFQKCDSSEITQLVSAATYSNMGKNTSHWKILEIF